MRCPFCGHAADKVIDSREVHGGDVIRRRRSCADCGRRYTTYERIETIPAMIVKKDGRRESFDRSKLLKGLLKAVQKRPVSVTELEAIANEVEAMLAESPRRELSSSEVGSLVMERLRDLDKVAYVRFASVYREFEDVDEFLEELKTLRRKRGRRGSGGDET